MANMDESLLEAACFLGDTLGPLFLYDPSDARVRPLYEQFASLDPNAAASEWPFADSASAHEGLGMMVASLGAAESAGRAAAAGVAGELGAVKAAESSGDSFDELVWEYRRLFVGPAVKVAPPWGSVYTDRECVIFGRSTLALREWLRRVGVSFHCEGVAAAGEAEVGGSAEGAGADAPCGACADHAAGQDGVVSNEPEDHIGLMLLLMSWLARNRPELLEEYLAKHMLTWAPHFLQIVQRESKHGFFVGLGLLTESSLEGLRAALGASVATPRFYR